MTPSANDPAVIESFDIVVLGGGNAFRVAQKTAEAGWRVALVEPDRLGGTCPNYGCIPSKVLWVHAHEANRVRRAERFGVHATIERIDADRILAEVSASTREVDPRFEKRAHENLTLVRAAGRFVGERTVRAGDRVLRGERVLIGTGTRPRAPEPDVIGDAPCWTNEDVFGLDRAPRSLVVVGGGFVATEMATFFDGLGVEVTLAFRGDEVLRGEDQALREAACAGLAERLDLRSGATWCGTERTPTGVRVTLERGGARETVEADALLAAIGRVPNTDELDLERAGVATDERGFVTVDDHLRTSADGVYALGDVRGGAQFTHTASKEAHELVKRLLGEAEGPIDLGPIPHAVFLDPPLAAVGLTEAQAREQGRDPIVATRGYERTAMGKALREPGSLCKLIVARDGELLGAHLVGSEAPELLHEIQVAMTWRNHVSTLSETMHVHPALAELVRDTAREAASQLTKA